MYLVAISHEAILFSIRHRPQRHPTKVKLFVYAPSSFPIRKKTNDKFNTTGLPQSIFLAQRKVFLDGLKTLGSWENFILFGFDSEAINLECKKVRGREKRRITTVPSREPRVLFAARKTRGSRDMRKCMAMEKAWKRKLLVEVEHLVCFFFFCLG